MMLGAGILDKSLCSHLMNNEELIEKQIEVFPYLSQGAKLEKYFYIYNDNLNHIDHFLQEGIKYDTIAGIISKIRIIKDKKGKKMAFVEIEDAEGSRVEITVFGSIYGKYTQLLKVGTGIYVKGKKNDFRGNITMVADEILPLRNLILTINRISQSQ